MSPFADCSLLALSVQDLPAVDAALNATATVLLVIGYLLIKQGKEQAHKWTMLAAFGVSVVFLGCYLTYHFHPGHLVRRPSSDAPEWFRTAYYAMLLSHVLLAAAVPFLALATIYYGLRDRRKTHRRLAWWTFPIWLYVSITGVAVYLVLYQLYPDPGDKPIMPDSRSLLPKGTSSWSHRPTDVNLSLSLMSETFESLAKKAGR